MIADLVATLGVWNWFVLGILLLAVEIFAPGTFILWLGMAAIGVGILSLVIDIAWQSQLIAFAVLSLVAVIGWWRFVKGAAPAANSLPTGRADRLIGRRFVLEEPIVNGAGRVRIDDSVWRVSGPDLAGGTTVEVASVDGVMLVVRKAG